MDERIKKKVGASKHCVFGACNSDSRPARPGYIEGQKFFPFPKPCLKFRKNPDEINLKQHIHLCNICKTCNEWVKSCKRKDGKFKDIRGVKKDSYICQKHFAPNTIVLDYENMLPLPSVQFKPVPTKRKTLDQMYGHNIKKPKNNKPNLKDTNNFNKFGETTANLIATSIATIKNDETIEKSTVENFVELQITANSAHTKQNKLTNKEIVQKGTFGNFKEEESTAVKVETTEIAKKSWKRSLQKDDIVIKRENNNVQYKATQTHATQTNNQESQTAVTQNKHQSTQTHATQISNQESQTAVTENIHQNTQTHATQTNNQESQTAVSQNIHQNTQTDIQETYFKMVKSSSAETTFIYKDQLALQDEVKILKAEIPSKT